MEASQNGNEGENALKKCPLINYLTGIKIDTNPELA